MAGAAGAFSIATLGFLNSGMKRDTGSVRRSFPSSISIRIATPVTGFDIDAMRKIASLRIGVLRLDVHQPLRLEMRDPPLARHHRDRAGDLARVDVASVTTSLMRCRRSDDMPTSSGLPPGTVAAVSDSASRTMPTARRRDSIPFVMRGIIAPGRSAEWPVAR